MGGVGVRREVRGGGGVGVRVSGGGGTGRRPPRALAGARRARPPLQRHLQRRRRRLRLATCRHDHTLHMKEIVSRLAMSGRFD